MITISLDEGGRFEQLVNPECMLIGGLAFRCDSNSEFNSEKACLKNFFQTICNEQGGRYPEDLHPERNSQGGVLNREVLSKIKKALADEMPDYLQKTGRWNQGRPAGSCYYTYCMVGDLAGIGDRSTSNLRDNIATVRYDHMIYRTIENLIFFNPYFLNETEYRLHLPTRIVNLNDTRQVVDRAALEKELKALGYSRRQAKDGSFDNNVYKVTDEASFRTALESALQNGDRKDLQFDLMVQSINYNSPQDHQVFLYLADTLCSIYQDAIFRLTTCEEALPALKDCCENLSGAGRAMIWGYHPVDRKWRSCWSDFAHGNWFDSLKTASEISNSANKVEAVYRDIWIRPFETVIDSRDNVPAINDALARLDNYMRNMEKRRQDTAIYIISHLEKCHNMIKKAEFRVRMEFMFSKIMTGLYNHRGNYVKAAEEYKKCMEAARYVSIEEYLGIQLFYIVCLCDAARYAEAEKLARDTVGHHQMLQEITAEITPANKLVPESYGRALSQHGQCLTLLGRFDEALGVFDQAMEIFAARGDDWLVTGSYRLHTLIEAGDKDVYSAEARNYFNASTPNKQFRSIMDGKCGNVLFALYVFLKGLWVFREGDDNPDKLREIIDTIARLAAEETKLIHPWEQIMKYCAFLWCRLSEHDNDHTRSEELMQTGRSALTDAEGILEIIRDENELQYKHVLQGEDYTTGSRLTFTYR